MYFLYISSLTPQTTSELDWIFATLAQHQTPGMLLQSLRWSFAENKLLCSRTLSKWDKGFAYFPFSSPVASKPGTVVRVLWRRLGEIQTLGSVCATCHGNCFCKALCEKFENLAIPEDFQTKEKSWFSVRRKILWIHANLTNIVVDSLEKRSL